MLTQEKAKEIFNYNLETGVLTWKISPRINIKEGDKTGAVNSKGYLQTWFCGDRALNHRIIWLYHYGYLPKALDHIDGDPLNNRIENLRECTSSENQYNSKIYTNNKSGFKGVHWHKPSRKYRAQIIKRGKQYRLGLFDDPEVAAQVVSIARLRLHGEFANHG